MRSAPLRARQTWDLPVLAPGGLWHDPCDLLGQEVTTMFATSLMTTTLIPAAGSTTLAFGPFAALAVLGIVAVGAVLVGGAIAEARRQRKDTTPACEPVALPHAA